MAYFVTGATGFIGRNLVERLLGATATSTCSCATARTSGSTRSWTAGAASSATPRACEPECTTSPATCVKPRLGVSDELVAELDGNIDHFFHLAALYDMTAPDEANRRAQRRAAPVTRSSSPNDTATPAACTTSPRSPSPATYRGLFREDMFDEGQPLPSPYHRTKFESERIVRADARGALARVSPGGRRRRLAHRRDGQDRRPVLLLQADPAAAPLAAGMGAARRSRARRHEHRAGRLRRRRDRPHRAPARPRRAGLPPHQPALAALGRGHQRRSRAPRTPRSSPCASTSDSPIALPEGAHLDADAPAGAAPMHARVILERLRHPRGGPRTHRARAASSTPATPSGRSPASEIAVPELSDYAPRALGLLGAPPRPGPVPRSLARGGHQRPHRPHHRRLQRDRPGGGAASSPPPAAIPLLVARSADKLRGGPTGDRDGQGGTAYVYSADLSSTERDRGDSSSSCSPTIRRVDMLVNNAGRSIRRSVAHSYDRFHDYERTMALNYFGTDQADHRAAAAHARARLRPHRQRLLDRRADEPAALLGLRGLEGGARRVRPASSAARWSATASPSRRSTCRWCARR